jgi:predicted HicB family RNase H-like nuclease
MTEEERKEATIIIRVKPSVKALAVKRAKQESRSLANYLERLIEQDAEAADVSLLPGNFPGSKSSKKRK